MAATSSGEGHERDLSTASATSGAYFSLLSSPRALLMLEGSSGQARSGGSGLAVAALRVKVGRRPQGECPSRQAALRRIFLCAGLDA